MGKTARVHMNGRVYDPIIGRMVSADPTIPDPMYSQAFNRYAYVYNNPMNSTDPSGFDTYSGTETINIDENTSTLQIGNGFTWGFSYDPGTHTGTITMTETPDQSAALDSTTFIPDAMPQIAQPITQTDSGISNSQSPTLQDPTKLASGNPSGNPNRDNNSSNTCGTCIDVNWIGSSWNSQVDSFGSGDANLDSLDSMGGGGIFNAQAREPQPMPSMGRPSGGGSGGSGTPFAPTRKPGGNGTVGSTDPVDEISREIAKVNAAEHAIRLREQQLDIQAMQGGSTLDAFWKNFQRETQHSGLAKQSLIVSSSVELSEIGDETALTTAEHLAEHGAANASSASAATTFEMLGRFIGGTEILVLGPKALGLGIDITNALKAANDLGSPQ